MTPNMPCRALRSARLLVLAAFVMLAPQHLLAQSSLPLNEVASSDNVYYYLVSVNHGASAVSANITVDVTVTAGDTDVVRVRIADIDELVDQINQPDVLDNLVVQARTGSGALTATLNSVNHSGTRQYLIEVETTGNTLAFTGSIAEPALAMALLDSKSMGSVGTLRIGSLARLRARFTNLSGSTRQIWYSFTVNYGSSKPLRMLTSVLGSPLERVTYGIHSPPFNFRFSSPVGFSSEIAGGLSTPQVDGAMQEMALAPGTTTLEGAIDQALIERFGPRLPGMGFPLSTFQTLQPTAGLNFDDSFGLLGGGQSEVSGTPSFRVTAYPSETTGSVDLTVLFGSSQVITDISPVVDTGSNAVRLGSASGSQSCSLSAPSESWSLWALAGVGGLVLFSRGRRITTDSASD